MDFYIDVFFSENLLLNYCVIVLAALLLRQKVKSYRNLLAASIGSIYACFAFIYGFENPYFQVVVKILVAVLMVLVAFKWTNFNMLFNRIVMFYASSFMLAGTLIGIQYLTKSGGEFANGIIYWRSDLKVVNIVFGVLCVFLLIKAIVDFMGRNKCDDSFMECELYFNGTKTALTGFIDTGNMLVEPFTGKPVLVVERNVVDRILDEEIVNGLLQKDSLQCDFKHKIRMIPFSSVGCERGMLSGFQADLLVIKSESKAYKIKGVIIAIANDEMSFNGYNALINPDLLKNV